MTLRIFFPSEYFGDFSESELYKKGVVSTVERDKVENLVVDRLTHFKKIPRMCFSLDICRFAKRTEDVLPINEMY